MKEPRKIGLSSPEFTPVDCPTMDDRLSDEALKSSGRRKQEKNDIHKFSMNVGTIILLCIANTMGNYCHIGY